MSIKIADSLLCGADRMLHARDPYVGARLMYRVQCWSKQRHYSALPAPCLCSTGCPSFMPDRMRGAKNPRKTYKCDHHSWIKAPPLGSHWEDDLEGWFLSIQQPYDAAADAAAV